MLSHHNRAALRHIRGFTLVELLVVIGAMAILFTVVVPGVSNMITNGQRETAEVFLSAAIATARTHAALAPPMTGGEFQGSAIIVSPAGELRIVKHDDRLVDGNGQRLVEKDPPRAGYANADAYRMLPEDAGIVGVLRNDSGRMLLAPPFAIRFDRHGHLIAPAPTSNDTVGYRGHGQITGNNSLKIFLNKDRTSPRSSSPYNADQWDPTSASYIGDHRPDGSWGSPDPQANDNHQPGYKLPFDVYESVIAVVMFSKKEFRKAGLTMNSPLPSGGLDTNARDWILNNGKPLFINRYSGAILKP